MFEPDTGSVKAVDENAGSKYDEHIGHAHFAAVAIGTQLSASYSRSLIAIEATNLFHSLAEGLSYRQVLPDPAR